MRQHFEPPPCGLRMTLLRSFWCGWRDSNSHFRRNQILNLARLPVPPHPHISDISCQSGGIIDKALVRSSWLTPVLADIAAAPSRSTRLFTFHGSNRVRARVGVPNCLSKAAPAGNCKYSRAAGLSVRAVHASLPEVMVNGPEPVYWRCVLLCGGLS